MDTRHPLHTSLLCKMMECLFVCLFVNSAYINQSKLNCNTIFFIHFLIYFILFYSFFIQFFFLNFEFEFFIFFFENIV